MLILTRKSKESIIIGNNIEVKILSIHGDQVSLGLTAPNDVTIYRKEIYEAIQKENIQAASKGADQMLNIRETLSSQFNKKTE